MSICQLKGVTKTYGSGPTSVRALRGVDLTIEAGEFAAICGPSGSGKTTLLNLLGCLDVQTSGVVEIAGTEIGALSARERARLRAEKIGFIFQTVNLIPVLSAAENVETALHLARTPGNRPAMAREMLAAVGLGDMVGRRPGQLSGGQQQRVAGARALVKRPALVIADEPTANLDSETGGRILDLMREMNQQLGATFLLSTHDTLVMSRVSRLLTMRDGVLTADERREGEDRAASGREDGDRAASGREGDDRDGRDTTTAEAP